MAKKHKQRHAKKHAPPPVQHRYVRPPPPPPKHKEKEKKKDKVKVHRTFWEGFGHQLLKGTKLFGRSIGKGGGILGRMAGAGIGTWLGGWSGGGIGGTIGGVIGDGIAEKYNGVVGSQNVSKVIKAEYKMSKHLYHDKNPAKKGNPGNP
jgi:hypothetical protein